MKKSTFFTICFFICLISIEFLATTNQEFQPIQNSWDKANHFIAFLTLYVILSFGYAKLKTQTKVLILLAFGIQIEIVQAFLPYRESSLLDIFADEVGIFSGIFVVALFHKIAISLQNSWKCRKNR